MAYEEKLHQFIHTNLKLLHDSGCKIDFEEDMFRNPNLIMFEKVGYGLLMIVDPEECTKNIPWPLLENPGLRNKFRKNFVSFIKMINSKYPEAKIPEISTLSLRFPVGLKFLQFMLKLSTFAVRLEITRISTPQEVEELLPRFQPSEDAKDNIVKLNILKGATHTENLRIQELKDYQTTALPVIQQLKAQNEKICNEITLKSEQMKNEISNLKVDDLIKERLMNVEDNDIMTDWNTSVEQKIAQVRHQTERLDHLRNLAAECSRKAQAVVEGSQDLCLDGTQLAVSPALAKMAGRPVYNSKGEVVLAAVMEAGQALAAQLAQRTPSLPSPPEIQELLQEYRKLLVQSDSLRSTVESSITESQSAISKLQPVVYAHMKEKPVPDHFQYLRLRPTIQLVRVDSPSKHVSPAKEERVNRWSEIVKRKKSGCKSRVVCSVKQRRSSKWAMFETPDMKALRHLGLRSPIKQRNRPNLLTGRREPCRETLSEVTETSTSEQVTCPKSLLPTGAKTEVEEDILPLLGASNLPSDSAEPTPGCSAQPTPGCSAQPTRKFSNRKSLDDIVGRYKKLKKTMDANK